MTIIKVSELTGAALDWAVAKCETPSGRDSADGWLRDYKIGFGTWYSTNWSQGGPIIEREKIAVWWDGVWHSKKDGCQPHQVQDADRPLIAAMRCYVASKLGDEVDVPEELV